MTDQRPPSNRAVPSPDAAPLDERRHGGPNRGRVRLRHRRFASLPDSERRALYDQMAQVVARSLQLDGPFEDSWIGKRWEARCAAFTERSEAYVAFEGHEMVGFFVHHLDRRQGRPHTHFASAYVVPELQGRGLAFAANARAVFRMLARHPLSTYWVSGSVYNPIAVEGWRRRASLPGSFYPPIDGLTDPSPELAALAVEVAAKTFPDDEFDATQGVLRGRTRPRDSASRCSNDLVNRYFDDHVDPSGGDVVLFAVDGTRRLLLASVSQLFAAIPRALATAMTPRSRGSG